MTNEITVLFPFFVTYDREVYTKEEWSTQSHTLSRDTHFIMTMAENRDRALEVFDEYMSEKE